MDGRSDARGWLFGVVASLDFETYSEAGYYFDGRWNSVAASGGGGLRAVGAAAYAEHPSTEVLVACYSFGDEIYTWVPGYGNPEDLLEHVRSGGLVSAYNSFFEYMIWRHVCRRLYGWPDLPITQTRDTMAAVRAYGVPGALEKAALALPVREKKAKGDALIRRFSQPRSPSKKDLRLRNYLGADPERALEFYSYCAQDVRTERGLGDLCPRLSDYETEVWELDQRINERGVAVDVVSIQHCKRLVDGVSELLTAELPTLTAGKVTSAGQINQIVWFAQDNGVTMSDLTAPTVERVLSDDRHPVHQLPTVKRVLQIRQALGSASVKKLTAIMNRLCSDGRVRGLFAYAGAERTGRWAGRGPQPQNLPRGDVEVAKCTECGHWQGVGGDCRRCWGPLEESKWCFDAAVAALEGFATEDAEGAILRWGDVLGVVAGCLRAVWVPAPGHRFVCSDYRAIEAVVLAALAGEDWRLEVFHTHGKIYEQSASKITGIPFEEYLEYKKRTGDHHPTRQSIGKVAELASGYGGGLGAWKRFGADKHLSDEEIQAAVKRWRQESPEIVNMWYGLERTAVRAIQSPGNAFSYRSIQYHCDGKVLRCILPSGRPLVYQRPRVVRGETPWGAPTNRILFWGYNSNPQAGPIGWHELDTYGGRLTENVVQAVSRDILAHGMLNADRAGFNIVLHVHDEIVCEEPNDSPRSVAQLEACMGDLPAWAQGWPVIAQGGWEGRRYRKE